VDGYGNVVHNRATQNLIFWLLENGIYFMVKSLIIPSLVCYSVAEQSSVSLFRKGLAMPTQVSYPGVYIEEIPSGVRTITGVATSITAFIGRCRRGPVNEPRIVNNMGEFERIFGGLAADHTLAYAVQDFFGNGGSQAIIVRLYKPFFADDAARAAALATATAQAQTAADAVSAAAAAAAGVPAATQADVATAANGAVAAAGAPGQAALLAAEQVAAAAQTESTQPAADADSVAAAAASAVAVAVSSAAAQVTPRNRARLIFDNSLTLEAATPGAWGNQLQVNVDYQTKDADVTLYNLTIRDKGTGRSEVIRNVTGVANGVRLVSRVLANESSLVRVVDPVPASRPAETPVVPAVVPILVEATGSAVDSQPLSTEDDFMGSPNNKTGLFALEKADLFNLLCIPPDTREGDTPVEVYQKAMGYCKERRAMLIVDSPATWSANADTAAATAVAGLSGLGLNGPAARNAALFFPRIKKSDPMRDGQIDTFVPCGAIAGIFARTDATRGVWKAPAGLDAALNGIAGLQVNLSDPENGQLNPLGINSLRTFPAAGRVVWGARTLRGADSIGDEYKYIPVRRLALFIEETLYRSTQWVVFEPNDEPLWAQIRLNLGAFMQNLFRQGAFQGKSPRDAYFVKCDSETTIQNDIDLGIVNIVVGFAPLKPAEFVIIKIQQIAGQIAT
jgi:phage tail sheath protein FI